MPVTSLDGPRTAKSIHRESTAPGCVAPCPGHPLKGVTYSKALIQDILDPTRAPTVGKLPAKSHLTRNMEQAECSKTPVLGHFNHFEVTRGYLQQQQLHRAARSCSSKQHRYRKITPARSCHTSAPAEAAPGYLEKKKSNFLPPSPQRRFRHGGSNLHPVPPMELPQAPADSRVL